MKLVEIRNEFEYDSLKAEIILAIQEHIRINKPKLIDAESYYIAALT